MTDDRSHGDDRRHRRADPLTFLGGLFIPVLAVSLIFGNALVGLTALLVGGLVVALSVLPATRPGLASLTATPQRRGRLGSLIPLLAVAGIFGNALLMVGVLILAAAALLAAGLGLLPPSVTPQPQDVHPSPPPLPEQASGEKITDIEIRSLCRGLPPAVAGQVLATFDHLERVEVEASRSGDSRRCYDARQGLQDYLPKTIDAWKALPEADRNVSELEAALSRVRQIAGPDEGDGEAGRRAWDTQQRFLIARSERATRKP